MKFVRSLILLISIVLLINILSSVSAVNYGSYTDSDYITPTTLQTYKTATVESVLKINYVKGDSGNPVLRVSMRLIDSSGKPMWENGWNTKYYRDLYGLGNKDTKELIHHGTDHNSYYYVPQWECGKFPNNYVYIYMETTVPHSTSEPYFYNDVTILQKISGDLEVKDTKHFKITIKGDIPEPSIDLDANPLSKTIDPETTTYHQFTVTNLIDSDCYVSFEYEIIFKDIYDEKMDPDGWEIDFYNSDGVKIYWVQVEGKTTEICDMAITSPKASEAPADATLKIILTAKAVNDIDRSVTEEIGGDRLKTSRDFTGANAGTSIWQSTLMYFGILIMIIVVVIIVLFRITTPKR